MEGQMAQAIAKGIVRDMAELVKGSQEKLVADGVVPLEVVEQQLQQMVRQWAGQVLGMLAGALRQQAQRQVLCCCGGVCRYKGEQERGQETLVGRLSYRRGYYYCTQCRRGYYLLDEAMAVVAGQFSAGLQEAMALEGTTQPFGPAARQLERLLGVVVSPSALERVTHSRGAALEARSRELGEQVLSGVSEPTVAPDRERQWVVELDAAKAHFSDGWHEVKVGVVCVAQAGAGGGSDGGEKSELGGRMEAAELSYVGHVGSMEEGGDRLYAEALERGVRPWQDRVVCLADGAPGNWSQFELHFPRRVEILDWYHATEDLWAAGKAGLGEGTPETTAWVKGQEKRLWQGQVQAVIEAIEALAQATGIEALGREAYFRANQERTRYDHYRACGYPLGSGAVESACKQLVGARLKGPGMCWTTAGAQSVLSLRCALLSNRWDQAWSLTRTYPKAA